jgi:hypothetical protein
MRVGCELLFCGVVAPRRSNLVKHTAYGEAGIDFTITSDQPRLRMGAMLILKSLYHIMHVMYIETFHLNHFIY